MDSQKMQALLNFQRGIYDFERGQNEILGDSDFVNQLIDYLLRLVQKGRTDVATRVLEKLREYTCCDDPVFRERSLFIVSVFTDRISDDENADCIKKWIKQYNIIW